MATLLTTTLDQLPIGSSALVDSIASTTDGGDFDVALRLKELGFVQGEKIKILHKGYFGGEPIAVRIGQSTFALRKFEAALISVIQPGSV
ncbi:ferrous iron transport protein A [Undibacterium sp.]|uniref:FeoA family protein n=1 Tax=Undibacterium sp. TaxID=1914977 RepID=UPI00374D1F22